MLEAKAESVEAVIPRDLSVDRILDRQAATELCRLPVFLPVLMSLTQLKPRLMQHERRLNAIWQIGRGRHIPVGTGGRPS